MKDKIKRRRIYGEERTQDIKKSGEKAGRSGDEAMKYADKAAKEEISEIMFV
ncbi:MAG: hypothetical protein SYNGOMJ08_00357 [Candidatus Syntrophoarchaeum sp. GoM_oil]|nr:MAG: hypothetical protein SYNGOMJ08_00357 [Candidatus Syntrophoarchaeum sp. GoM_oil]